MTHFSTDIADKGTRFFLNFYTDDKDKFLAMQVLARKCVDNVPTADVVEAVRCNDCRFWKKDCVENADTHIPLEELWGVSLPIRSVGIGICECEKFYGDRKDERFKLYRVLNPLETTKDDYCSFGERKEDNER